jgi:hypothetical protein
MKPCTNENRKEYCPIAFLNYLAFQSFDNERA